VNRFDVQLVLDRLAGIKHKNYFSQGKNAFLHFCELHNIKLSSDTLESIRGLEKKTKKKYRRLRAIDFKQVDNRIKHIRNKKLKLSYQAIMATGLRVSELAQLGPNDCAIAADSITFNFIGKGRRNESATIQATEHPKLYKSLLELVRDMPANKKVFYSAPYLQAKARPLGFSCHDLRRVFAKLEYRKCGSKTEVMSKLRHSNVKTTNIYLRSRVKIT